MQRLSTSLLPPDPVIDALHDRRAHQRLRTVYRVARLQTREDEGLARVRNISDTGLKLSTGMPMTLGDIVRVALSDTLKFQGEVIWANGDECGVKFSRAIDSFAVLRQSAEQVRSGECRAPRLTTRLPAVVCSERGMHATNVVDISQRGMKVTQKCGFTPGIPVKVVLGSGVERRGYVRWARDDFAGLMLAEPFSVEDLRSVSAL